MHTITLPVPRPANLAEAAAHFDKVHGELVAEKEHLLAEALDACDVAEKAQTRAAAAALIATAHELVAKANAVQAQIDRIEACWV